ncbi:MAG: LamG domain-containing protein [bacterium]|nr:LamG domain-containing protein [bacterium]
MNESLNLTTHPERERERERESKRAPAISLLGFTLIELLIVIGILAVLAVAVVLVLNPAQLFKEARDSKRLSELQTIHKALGQYQADGKTYLGETDKVYVSIPDSSTTCANLGLPSLPTGWEYRCSSSDNYRKADNTGWVPVPFTSISWGSNLSILPIDPVNTTSTGNYYTYVVGGSWEMTALFESDKYADKAINDGDAYPGVYSLRTSTSPLTPGIRDKGMVGYWKFDEGSGTTASDSSGNSKTASFIGSPSWVTGKIGTGVNTGNTVSDYINAPNVSLGSTWTATAWFQYPLTSTGSSWWTLFRGNAGDHQVIVERKVSQLGMYDNVGGTGFRGTGFYMTSLSTGWHHIAVTGSGGKQNFYINGNYVGQSDKQSTTDIKSIGNHWGGSQNWGTVDEVRIYNRALSAAEIMAIYNATK